VLGNLNAKRDWGYAPEYCEGMWRILQYDKADDFVLATGEAHSIKEFVEYSFKQLGITLVWSGSGQNEIGVVETVNLDFLNEKINERIPISSIDFEDKKAISGFQQRSNPPRSGDCIIKINPRYFRPTEVELLIGNSNKAKLMLNWQPETNLSNLIRIMIDSDIFQILIEEKQKTIASI
jgi:GDPmannose 4,6-dehydratase